jgi:hypothetical protein
MSSPKREVRKRSQTRVPTGYAAVLADVKQWIAYLEALLRVAECRASAGSDKHSNEPPP